MLSTKLLREKFLQKLLNVAIQKEKSQRIGKNILQNLSWKELEYKHCQRIAELMDWEANSVARLFGINESFPPTKLLNPTSEKRVLAFLGEKSMEILEKN